MRKYRVARPETVKSRASFRPGWRLGVLVTGLLISFSFGAFAKKPKLERSWLMGGPVLLEKPTAAVDPLLPRGELRPLASGLVFSPESVACSWRRPLCVAAAKESERLRRLELLEVAYEKLVLGAGLPRTSGTLGDGLVWGEAEGPLRIELEERPSRGFDRAGARCLGGEASLAVAVECLAAASIAELSPATADELRTGYGKSSAWDVLGPGPSDIEWVQKSLQRPEAGVLTRESEGAAPPRGRSALFFQFLGEQSEQRWPLSSGFYLLSLAATRTPPGALRFESEPDALDVLRASLGEAREPYALFFDAFARARAKLGTPEFLPELGKSAGGVRFAWDIEATTLPRHLVLPRALYPTGSAYVRLRLGGAERGATLGFRVQCEIPIRTVWSLSFESDAGELSVMPIAYRESTSSYEQRATLPKEATRVVLTGTNLDSIDLAHPFDPDHAPHEGHVCTVYISRL